MPRAISLIVLAVLLVAALAAALANWHTLPFAVALAILLFGLLFERYIYKPIRPGPPGPEWDKTPEKFEDPQSGRPVVVYYNPRTGQRRYVADDSIDVSNTL
jgi:hypothetical protein